MKESSKRFLFYIILGILVCLGFSIAFNVSIVNLYIGWLIGISVGYLSIYLVDRKRNK